MKTRSAANVKQPINVPSPPPGEESGSVTAGAFGGLPLATQRVLSSPTRVTRSTKVTLPATGVTAGVSGQPDKGKKRRVDDAEAVSGTTTSGPLEKRSRKQATISQAGPSSMRSYPDSYEDVIPTQRTLNILALLPLRKDEANPEAPPIKLASDFLALHFMSVNNSGVLEQFAHMGDAQKIGSIKDWMRLTSTKKKGKKIQDPESNHKIRCQEARKHFDPLLRGDTIQDGGYSLDIALTNFVKFCQLRNIFSDKTKQNLYTRLRGICFASCLPVAEACREAISHDSTGIVETDDTGHASSSRKTSTKKVEKDAPDMLEQYLPTIDEAMVHLGFKPATLLAPRSSQELDEEFFKIIESLRRNSHDGASNYVSTIVTTWRLHTHTLESDRVLQQAARELLEQPNMRSLGLKLLAARLAEFLHVRNIDLIDFSKEVDKFRMKGEDDAAQWSWSRGTVDNPVIRNFFTWIAVVISKEERDTINVFLHRIKLLLDTQAIRDYRTQQAMAVLRQQTVYSLDEITTALSSIREMKRHVVFSLDDSGNVVVAHRYAPVEGGRDEQFGHEQIHDPSLNTVFPFRDPTNPTRVHPYFVNPTDHTGKTVAQGVTVSDVILPRQIQDKLWELARGNTSLTKQDFFDQYKDGLRDELMATMKNQAPPSSARTQVVRLTEEQCETEAEKAALKGQYGVILKDNLVDNCPVLPHTYGLFAGSLIEDDEHEDAYEKTFLDAHKAERAAKDYGVATPASRRGKKAEYGPEYFPYGGGNDTQFYNCACKPDGTSLVADEDRCHAIFVPVIFRLIDASGKERELPIMNVVPTNVQPTPPYQIMLSYGPGYALDIAHSVVEQTIKTEPQDDATLATGEPEREAGS